MQRIPEPEYMDLPEEAEAYAAADFSDVNDAFADSLAERAGAASATLALDLGTGPCDIPVLVARRCPRWRIVAVDAAMAMLRLGRSVLANAGVSDTVAPLCTDAKRLPFADATFDVVFSNSILHHVDDPALFWREIRRVVKPDGYIFLRDLARPESPDAARAIVDAYAGGESVLLQEEFYRSLLAAYTPDEVRVQLAAAGLHNLNVAMASDRHLDAFGRI